MAQFTCIVCGRPSHRDGNLVLSFKGTSRWWVVCGGACAQRAALAVDAMADQLEAERPAEAKHATEKR